MRKYLYRYDRVLDGLLITYRNGKFLGCSGDMVNGLLEIQCNIEADFYIFQPKVGERLRGRVKEVTADYIELVIHKGINATIPKPLFSDELWIGDTLSVNQKVLFTPTIIDLRSYSLDIQGTFNETYEHNFEYEKNLILSSESESDSEEQDEKEE
ncbi:DNA-directed RNA polymerase I subunit RPA43-like [Trichogramma pretiosum]|uniref:DNA-directed RNA polymerase I subunit RPA43-like n=1 Tax=Trichogramma pretiosum TaxID=7493 RepID=UPI000C71BBFC|nr:DNA-directed RNA polymerase I subunit RPA43-like [Trichogramma pretiosum]